MSASPYCCTHHHSHRTPSDKIRQQRSAINDSTRAKQATHSPSAIYVRTTSGCVRPHPNLRRHNVATRRLVHACNFFVRTQPGSPPAPPAQVALSTPHYTKLSSLESCLSCFCRIKRWLDPSIDPSLRTTTYRIAMFCHASPAQSLPPLDVNVSFTVFSHDYVDRPIPSL